MMNNRHRQKRKIFRCNYDLFIRYLASLLTEEDKEYIRTCVRELKNNHNEQSRSDEIKSV